MKSKNLLLILFPLLLLNSCGGSSSSSSSFNTSSIPPISLSPTLPSLPPSSFPASSPHVVVSHKDFISAKSGTKLAIKAVLNYATKDYGQTHEYFMQDNDGGYNLKGNINVEEGKSYIISGSKVYDAASEKHLLQNLLVLQEVENEFDQTPLEISETYANPDIGINRQGSLVSMRDVVFTMTPNISDNKKTLPTARKRIGAPNFRFLIYRDYIGDAEFARINAKLSSISVNQPFTVTRAIFTMSYGEAYVVLLNADDVLFEPLEEMARQRLLIEKNIRINYYQEGDVYLAQTYAGNSVKWISSNRDIIGDNGKRLTKIIEPTPVSFTVTSEVLSFSKTYDIVLIPQQEIIDVNTKSPDLFISEIYEGSNTQNHAIEIFNNTGKSVDLTHYEMRQYINGDPGDYIVENLSGVLEDKKCLVLYDNREGLLPSFKSALKALEIAKIPLLKTGVATFTGNDPLVLFHDGIAIDTIGEVGVLHEFVKNYSLFRDFNNYIPRSFFSSGEWWFDYNQIDYFEDLGYHQIIA